MASVGKYIVKGIMAAFAALPLKVHYANARFLSWFVRCVVRYRVSDVVINLSRAFPEKTYPEIKQLTKDFYRHFADLVVEAIWFGGCRNPKRLRRQHIVEVTNLPEFNAIYEKAPSVVVLYTHCGNWELLGGIESYNYSDAPTLFREDNYCVVYRQMSSKMWDSIMRDNRFAPLKDRKGYPGYLESKLLVRYVMSHRDEKKVYNINTDQRPYYSAPDFVKVNFMHREVTTMSAGAALARKMGMAVFYQKMRAVERGRYELTYIPICEDASKMSLQEIMDRYYALLEEEIKETPWNYLWTHRRWY